MDFGVHGKACMARALWALGYRDQARTQSQEALTLAVRVSHPFSQAVVLDYGAMNAHFCRDTQETRAWAVGVIGLCRELRFAY